MGDRNGQREPATVPLSRLRTELPDSGVAVNDEVLTRISQQLPGAPAFLLPP